MIFRRYIVRKHERALLFRDGDFVRFLDPGVYRYYDLLHRHTVERYDISAPAFEHRLADFLVESCPEEVEARFEVVSTAVDEAAVVYHNERIAAIIGPAERRLYWKGVIRVRVERYSVGDGVALPAQLARRLLSGGDASVLALARDAVYARLVPEGSVGVLYVDGELRRTLAPGLHAFWVYEQSLALEQVDTRVRTLEVGGQEILTRDKVSLRVNVTATFQFRDVEKALREVTEPLDHLYKEIQFGLRAAIGTRTLDTLLEDKTAIDTDVAAYLGERFEAIGIAVLSVGVKDIILPGDMKELLGKVVEAEKAAQANVIRRREETNATRSLLNTAKTMEGNRVALRLKELETLEKVTEKIGTISVYGGLDSVLTELVRLKQ